MVVGGLFTRCIWLTCGHNQASRTGNTRRGVGEMVRLTGLASGFTPCISLVDLDTIRTAALIWALIVDVQRANKWIEAYVSATPTKTRDAQKRL